jgi:hypothetical protein
MNFNNIPDKYRKISFSKRDKWKNALPLTRGFTQAGVYARRNICANLQVCRPPEPL